MKLKFFLLACIIITIIPAYSQIGFSLQGGNFALEEDPSSNEIKTTDLQQFTTGISYQLALKDVRIEFLPGIYAIYGKGKLENADQFNRLGVQFSVPINFYLLDLGSDCNCPTFNKQGQAFEKGFHFFLLPGMLYLQHERIKSQGPEKGAHFEYLVGLGLGFDFGLNRHSTLSPFVYYSRHFNQHLDFNNLAQEWYKSSGQSSINAGIRYTWYTKKRR